MAILACTSSSSKENLPPQHAVGIKSHRMKRPGAGGIKARTRAPLRDITNLFLADVPRSVAATSAAVPLSSREGQAQSPISARSGAPGVVTVKGTRSLRKDFR
ncbi:unnamed protein product [Alopecurus aequalis]